MTIDNDTSIGSPVVVDLFPNPEKKKHFVPPTISIGVDELGVPNITLATVYGVFVHRKNGESGTILFNTREKRDDALKKYAAAAKFKKITMTFQPMEYPVF